MLEYLNKKDQVKVEIEENKKEMIKSLVKEKVYASL
jgi:hypothetical protein